MLNPLSHLVHRDPAKLSLRERFAATREKYARTLRVHRALNGPLPVKPAEVVPPRANPSPDAALKKALGDLQRLDAAIDALHSGPEFQGADEVPGYRALEDARDEVLASLAGQHAKGLAGLQAKASALLIPEVVEAYEDTGAIARSLARDLLGSAADMAWVRPNPTPSAASTGTDPVHAIIAEHRTAFAEWEPHLERVSELPINSPEYHAAEAAGELSRIREEAAFDALIGARPASLAGLLDWAAYLPGAIERNSRSNADDDGVLGLVSMCEALRGLADRRAIVGETVPALSGVSFDASGIIGRLDFASMPMRSLETLQVHAETLSHVSYGLAAQPRSRKGDAADTNEVGDLMIWLAEEVFCRLQDSCYSEAERRAAVTDDDRETRLHIIARSVICNNDPDELRAFARDLLALAEA